MPRTTDELVEILMLASVGEGCYLGHHPQTLVQRSYGGQVLAQALLAAAATVPEHRPAHSLSASFVRPGDSSADICYDVVTLSDSRTFSRRQINARQGEEVILSMVASFKSTEPGLDHFDAAPEGVPGPDQSRPLVEVMNQRFGASPIWHEWDALDVRLAHDTSEEPPGTPARMQVWVRTQDEVGDDPMLHQALLAYLSDLTLLSVSTLPHEVVFLSRQVQAASLGHAMWFHRPARADRWLLYDMTSPSASNAIGFCQGRLFQDGRLVASSTQEGLVRVVADRAVLT